MKLLADANPLYTGHLTGVGYFTERLLAHIAETNDVTGFAFNFRGRKSPPLPFRVREQTILPGKVLSYPRYAKIDIPLATFFSLKGYDAVLGTNYLLPPTGSVPNITTIHDMCFVDHPEWVQGRNAHILKKMLPKTLKRSRGLLAVSQFSADRVREIYDYHKPILVVGIPPQPSGAGTIQPPILKTRGIDTYYLLVSTIEPRKNVMTLVRAYEMLPNDIQKHYPLILAGKPGWDPEALDYIRSGKNSNIVYLDYVTEAEKNWLYGHALCTVIPSHYEGFGMMSLESLLAGTAVISSDIPPQREIFGESGRFFEPSDATALCKLMESMADKSYRSGTLHEQKKVLGNYSWENTASRVVEFIKENV